MKNRSTNRFSLAASDALLALASIFTGLLCPVIAMADEHDVSRIIRATSKALQVERDRSREDFERFSQQRDHSARIKAARDWALSSFEADERGTLPSAGQLTSRMARMQQKSRKVRQYLLNCANSADTRGAVRSGRALNWFLDSCGPTALDHEMTKDKINEDFQRLTKLCSAGNHTPDQLEQYKHELEALTEYKSAVDQIGGRNAFDAYVHDRLRYSTGVTGAKAIINNRDTGAVLETRWPAFIRQNPDYLPLTKAFDTNNQLALLDLQNKQPVSNEVASNLLRLADKIDGKLHAQFREYAVGANDALTTSQFMRAKSFVKGLRSSVFRLVEANDLVDVRPSERFEGRTIESLLCYMTRNGYHFAEADANAEHAYRLIYREMVEYYNSLNNLRYASERAGEDLERWQQYADRQMARYQQTYEQGLESALKAVFPTPINYHFTYENQNNQTGPPR